MPETQAAAVRGSHISPGDIDDILPVVGLAQTVLFPGMTCALLLGTVRALGAVREAMRGPEPRHLVICTAKETRDMEPSSEAAALHRVGVLAQVLSLHRHPSGMWLAEFSARRRVEIQQVLRDRPFRLARVKNLCEEQESPTELESLVLMIRHHLLELKRRAPMCTVAGPLLAALAEARAPEARISVAMGCMALLPVPRRQALLEAPKLAVRLEAVLEVLAARVSSHAPSSVLC